MHIRVKCNNLDFLVPPNFDHRILFDLVSNMVNTFISNISLLFQHLDHGYTMNITDEEDVRQLINVMSEIMEVVHLYLEAF